jgi:phosphoribosyl 1,2-cyclic phosphodiesterase
LQIFSLGSGSSGNAFLVTTERAAVLLDCGVLVRSCTAAVRDLATAGSLDAVLLSHEHIDHVRALPSIAKRLKTPIVTTRGTRSMLSVEANGSDMRGGERFEIADLAVTFVEVAHDAAEPCGFFIEAGGHNAAIFTDLGHVTPSVRECLANADVIVIEANYDPGMLRRGPYPERLKRRIAGSHGHLSNDDCAAALAASVGRARAVWLAHLSETNNEPRLAEATINEALGFAGASTRARALPRFERQDVTGHARPAASQARMTF